MGSHRPAVETPTLSDGWKKMQISLLTVLATLLVLASSAPQNRPSLTRDRPQGRNQNQPNTLPTRCSTRAGTGAAPGTPTPRAPTIGSSATPTLTTGSSDSLEALPPLPRLRMPVSLPTAAEQRGEEGEPGELHTL